MHTGFRLGCNTLPSVYIAASFDRSVAQMRASTVNRSFY